jgi:urease accessory protein
VDAELGPGARLAWVPEPLVACAGCRHRGRARLRMAGGARAVWSEAVALGRTGEQPGDVELRLDADADGVPLLRDGLRLGPSAPGWDGPAVADGARHLGTVALLGAEADPTERELWLGDAEVAAPAPGFRGSAPQAPERGSLSMLRLAGPGVVVRATGPTGAEVERLLAPARRGVVAALWGNAATGRAEHSRPEESRQVMVM